MSAEPWPPELRLAETHVDWHRMQRHIDSRRESVEKAAVGKTRKLATSLALTGHLLHSDVDDLAALLQASLDATALFGFRSAQAEVQRSRGQRVTLAYELPSVGDQAKAGASGIEGVRRLVKRRAREATDRIVTAAQHAAAKAPPLGSVGLPAAARATLIVTASRKALHRVVLELVGETLNQGRTAGAMSMSQPPEFAMRSSVLDANSCEPCEDLNGEIFQIGSADYYDNTPPSGCLGGGRCRCVYVFGDDSDAMEQAA